MLAQIISFGKEISSATFPIFIPICLKDNFNESCASIFVLSNCKILKLFCQLFFTKFLKLLTFD